LREINVLRIATFRRLLGSDDGLSMSEYAVMLALIVCLCMGPVQTLGCKANQAFTNASKSLKR
jgi:Flp pilus assembly pilin Flp